MARTEREPRAKDVDFPVFVPSKEGATNIEMGKGSLRHGTLVIEFKNNLPGVAIQRMIERGVILGLSFVMLAPDDVNLKAQDRLEQIDKDNEDLEKLEGDSVTVQDVLPAKDDIWDTLATEKTHLVYFGATNDPKSYIVGQGRIDPKTGIVHTRYEENLPFEEGVDLLHTTVTEAGIYVVIIDRDQYEKDKQYKAEIAEENKENEN